MFLQIELSCSCSSTTRVMSHLNFIVPLSYSGNVDEKSDVALETEINGSRSRSCGTVTFSTSGLVIHAVRSLPYCILSNERTTCGYADLRPSVVNVVVTE